MVSGSLRIKDMQNLINVYIVIIRTTMCSVLKVHSNQYYLQFCNSKKVMYFISAKVNQFEHSQNSCQLKID
jgi:hypothetical protein